MLVLCGNTVVAHHNFPPNKPQVLMKTGVTFFKLSMCLVHYHKCCYAAVPFASQAIINFTVKRHLLFA